MKKIDLIEDVIHYLSGGNQSSDSLGKFHPDFIANRVSDILETVVLNIYLGIKRNMDFNVFDSLLKTYDATIYKSGKKYYIDLPVEIMGSLPSELTIRRVFIEGDDWTEDTDFAIMDNEAVAVISQLPVAKISTTPFVTLQGDKLVCHKINQETPIKLTLMPSFSSYEDEDNINLPNIPDNDLVTIVIGKLQGMLGIPEDKTADNKNIAEESTPKRIT